MTMTKKNALTIAISALETSAEPVDAAAVEILRKMVDSLSKTRTLSDEAKAKQSELRKAKTAAARSELVAKVAPIIRAAMTTEPQTAKEIFANCVGLPEDFTAAKVQNVLLRELRDSINVNEAKGKANTYNL